MRGFIDLIERFRSDERGAFLVIFGILGVVLIATAGAVVDFTSIEQARTRAQQALDSAALGLQPTIYDTPAPTSTQLKTKAQTLLTERLGDASIVSVVDVATTNLTEGTLHLEGAVTVKTSFVQLIGIPTVRVKLVSEATRKMLNLEVVMVLDNSLSMNQQNRMSELEDAAECAVDVLFNGNCNSTATTAANANVWIGIVPFTLQVNVGTGNANASWLDRNGSNGTGITNDNFDSDDNDTTAFTGTVDRIALMNQLGSANWGGCVEARKYPYDTNDALPVAGTDTMFTPLFAPDEPDGWANSYLNDRPASCTNKDLGSWTWTQNKYTCTKNGSSQYNYDTASCNNGSTTNSYSQKNSNGSTVTAATSQPATLYGNDASCSDEYSTVSQSGYGSSRRYQIRRVRTCLYQFSDRELQERLCKYTNATVSGASQSSIKGPNVDCPSNAITPLTNTKSTVISAINALAPQGATNIHAGAIWGFHVLSPTAPFTEGKAYDAATSKVMIIMTDGENTSSASNNMNGASWYSFYGFPWNERLGDTTWDNGDIEDEMNDRLVETCTNAKAAGIRIYTVGLSVDNTSNPDENEQMLKDCSSGTGYWYFPDDNDDLSDVFETIADQLSNLRLAK